MKTINYSKTIFRGALIFGALLCALTMTIFAQKNTYTPSPCVAYEAGKNPKSVINVWANLDYEPCKKTIALLRGASVLVYGIELKVNNLADDGTLREWLLEIGGNPVYKAKFDEGFKLGDANGFLKSRFAKMSDGWLEIYLVKVTDDIYGRPPVQAEKDFYVPRLRAQQETYTSMYLTEQNKLKQNAAARKAMISLAYRKAMGRTADAGNLSYWQPRAEVFKEIVAAGRSWLYSANGTGDLDQTIARAFQSSGFTNQITPERTAVYKSAFIPQKMIYTEMVAYFKGDQK